MPTYQRLGRVPRKRHIQFRENGTLLTEEVMGLEGFSGNESILYHLHSPCRVKEIGAFEKYGVDAELKQAVASPGGMTEAGLKALEQRHFREALLAAVDASLERARQ